MNWNNTDHDSEREDRREVQEYKAISEQAQQSSLFAEVRNTPPSLSELRVSGYDLFIRLIRR